MASVPLPVETVQSDCLSGTSCPSPHTYQPLTSLHTHLAQAGDNHNKTMHRSTMRVRKGVRLVLELPFLLCAIEGTEKFLWALKQYYRKCNLRCWMVSLPEEVTVIGAK